jgi:hypothetical protein
VFVGLFTLFAWWAHDESSILPPDDFVEYWAAGRLNLNGGNPYDAEQLVPLEREAGRPVQEAVMMWNPPWTLSFVMPIGALSPRTAQFVWLGVHFLCVMVSAGMLWFVFGGRMSHVWVAGALALSFAPTKFLLLSGQISGFLLLGLSGFLWGVRQRRFIVAGLFATLVAVKPHLFLLLWITFLLEGFRHRQGRTILLSGILFGGLAGLVPLLINPEVYHQYFAAMKAGPPSDSGNEAQVALEQWQHPLLSYQLRMWLAPTQFWIQFLPTLLATAGWVVYWFLNRTTWDWDAQLPWLILLALLTASYGAWGYDLVVLLLPLIRIAVSLASAPIERSTLVIVAVYLSLNLVAWTRKEHQEFIWLTPAVLAASVLWHLWNRAGKHHPTQ